MSELSDYQRLVERPLVEKLERNIKAAGEEIERLTTRIVALEVALAPFVFDKIPEDDNSFTKVLVDKKFLRVARATLPSPTDS